jgi:hypothetical protein
VNDLAEQDDLFADLCGFAADRFPHRPIRCARDDRRRLGYRRVLPHAGSHADHRPPPWPRR